MSVAPTIIGFSKVSDYHTDFHIGHRGLSRALLSQLKLPIPAGFVITPTAFYRFLHYDNGLNHWRNLIANIQAFSNEDMVTCAGSLQKLVIHHSFDPELAEEIRSAYHQTLKKSWAHLTISPTPDTPAPVHYPLPVIKGESSLLDFLRQIWAAQLTPHALSLHLSHHQHQIFGPAPVLVSQFEPAIVSGTVYSIDPQSQDKNLIRIEAIWGTNPQNDPQPIPVDVFILSKSTKEIISRLSGKQSTQMIIDRFGHLKTSPLSSKQITSDKLTPDNFHTLIQAAIKTQNTMLKPQAINWLIADKQIFFTRFTEIADSKPVFTKPISTSTVTKPTILATGLPAAPGIATAPIIRPHLNSNISGRIAIFTQANPLLIKRANTAAGIIIESGGLTSELALAAKDVGIPTLVGTGPISSPDGQVVTLDASNGKVLLPLHLPQPLIITPTQKSSTTTSQNNNIVTATKIYLSLHQYDNSLTTTYNLSDGVGQCRGNHLVEELGIHPKYLLSRKSDQLKTLLSDALTTICDGFGDRPVWYQPFDLDTSSAAKLTHGNTYEPAEEQNPAIGFRGTYRIIHDDAIFAAELETIKQLRHKQNIKNLHLTLPLVRSIDEYTSIKRLISSHGLYQSPSFMIYAEIGTPSAINLIPQLAAEGVNGLHLNLDFLTMLLLGYDSNSAEVDQCLDYSHPTVIANLSQITQLAEKLRLPLIVHSFMFDQSSELIETAIKAGITALVISPNNYQVVKNWVTQSEAAAIHPKR